MKTLKLAMVAALIACTMISMASTDNGGKIVAKKVVNCTIEKALSDPGLRLAMTQQLNPSFLKEEKLVYTVPVNYNGTLYRISGTRNQWLMFFNPKIMIKAESKPNFGTAHE
jgi:hypothetical protein